MISRVLIDKRVLDGFKRRARTKFPVELMEIALGEVRGNDAVIFAFEKVEHSGTTGHIVTDDDYSHAQDQDEYQHVILGTVHSHPNDTVEPSRLDKRSAKQDGELIYGICAISESPKGRRYVSWGFWEGATHKALELVISE